MSSNTSSTVCVIGAGSSGIAACKALKSMQIPFDCYEAGDRIGGNWVYKNSNGMSSSYKSLHINSSKDLMQYSDYPMPESFPNFPHHSQIAKYFEDYANHFSLKQHIIFNTKVEQVRPLEQNGWNVKTNNEEKQYHSVIIANGHHWDPNWPSPEYSGVFTGKVTHSHYYKDSEEFKGKRVLVVGFGNSAMDIATELSHCSERVYLSVRRGFHITPKHVLGRPLDKAPIPNFLPLKLQLHLRALAVKLQVGDLDQYGLPKPTHSYMHAHPTISSNIFSQLSHGLINVMPAISKFDEEYVVFDDGRAEQIDVVIYCTGYKISFPFLDSDILSTKDNLVDLYLHIFHPKHVNLFFVGLIQPLGPVMPLAELQSQLIAKYLSGDFILPSYSDMKKDIEEYRKQTVHRYGASTQRHTIQVDYQVYEKLLKHHLSNNSLKANFITDMFARLSLKKHLKAGHNK
jgi:dimethylaniline monooxygenase (N-oxide forming)